MGNTSTDENRLNGPLCCRHCGAIRQCDAEQLIDFALGDWPECCGDTMLLHDQLANPAAE